MSKGISRRDFLKVGGAAAGSAFLSKLASINIVRAQTNTIEFWSQPYGDPVAWEALLQTLADEFLSESGIQVNTEIISWSTAPQTWLTVVQGGAHPDAADMFFLHSNAVLGGGQYGPRPITEYRDEFFPNLTERFFEPALVDVTWEEEFYGIPWRGDIRPMLYRVDFLEEAGFSQPPQTWEEIAQFAEALTVRDGGNVSRYGFNFGFAQPIQQVIPWIWQAGGGYMTPDGTTATIDTPEMRQTLEWMVDLVRTRGVVTPEFMEPSYVAYDAFAAGSLAMAGSVSDEFGNNLERTYPELDGRWAMALPPMGPARRAAYSGAGYWGVLHGSEKVEAAVEWIAFLARDENMLRLSQATARVSPNRNVMASDFWQDRPWKQVLVETLDYARTSQHPNGAWARIVAPQAGAVIFDLYYDTLVRGEPIEDVIVRTQERMQEEMDRTE